MTAHRHAERTGKLLVAVRGLSGTQYPVGTLVAVSGNGGSAVDAFVSGDWLPLRWWEFSDVTEDAGAPTAA